MSNHFRRVLLKDFYCIGLQGSAYSRTLCTNTGSDLHQRNAPNAFATMATCNAPALIPRWCALPYPATLHASSRCQASAVNFVQVIIISNRHVVFLIYSHKK